MTGKELHDALKDSGTGEAKLAMIQTKLDENDKLTGEEAYKALEAGGAPEGTLLKAREFLGAKLMKTIDAHLAKEAAAEAKEASEPPKKK